MTLARPSDPGNRPYNSVRFWRLDMPALTIAVLSVVIWFTAFPHEPARD